MYDHPYGAEYLSRQTMPLQDMADQNSVESKNVEQIQGYVVVGGSS